MLLGIDVYEDARKAVEGLELRGRRAPQVWNLQLRPLFTQELAMLGFAIPSECAGK